MTAAILPHPACATRLERIALRYTGALTLWITARANRRAKRHAAMRRRIHAEQTAPHDSRALAYDLARIGLPEK